MAQSEIAKSPTEVAFFYGKATLPHMGCEKDFSAAKLASITNKYLGLYKQRESPETTSEKR